MLFFAGKRVSELSVGESEHFPCGMLSSKDLDYGGLFDIADLQGQVAGGA